MSNTNQTPEQVPTQRMFRLGETARWSEGQTVEYKYVDIEITPPLKGERGVGKQTIMLPADLAFELCTRMADYRVAVIK
jgi:hypothetical protein